MLKLKKLRFGLMLAVAALMTVPMFVSCSNNDFDDETVPVSESTFPQKAREFLNTYYPAMQIVQSVREDDNGYVTYKVDFYSGDEVVFDHNGNWVEVEAPKGGEIPAGIAPDFVDKYIAVNYPDAGIHEIERSAVYYEVKLLNNRTLYFDVNGNYHHMHR